VILRKKVVFSEKRGKKGRNTPGDWSVFRVILVDGEASGETTASGGKGGGNGRQKGAIFEERRKKFWI